MLSSEYINKALKNLDATSERELVGIFLKIGSTPVVKENFDKAKTLVESAKR